MLRFNENNEIISEEKYRAILVGLQLKEDIAYSMEELSGLAEAADATVIGSMIQTLDRPNTATWIGKGKVDELAQLAQNMDADVVIFNDELTGMQIRNLEETVGTRVIDRTILILDIFAARAESAEGKLQVELAQLKYRLPRLTGFGKSLSRLGGGIGTRGPGEKKLETDRRHIESRMNDIKKELAHVQKTRRTQRGRRGKKGIPVVALVGYTNSGKSALMNCLLNNEDRLAEGEKKTVKERDMLFATLDTQQRRVTIDAKHEFILIDTVGFVSKLPHGLVDAFKGTLEEVTEADLLLHVVDSSFEDYSFHIEVTEKVLREIGVFDRDKIMVFNKMDKTQSIIAPVEGIENVFISAKYGTNIDKLLSLVKEKIFADMVHAKLMIPFARGDISSYLCEKANVESMEYKEKGTLFTVELTAEDYQRLKKYDIV